MQLNRLPQLQTSLLLNLKLPHHQILTTTQPHLMLPQIKQLLHCSFADVERAEIVYTGGLLFVEVDFVVGAGDGVQSVALDLVAEVVVLFEVFIVDGFDEASGGWD